MGVFLMMLGAHLCKKIPKWSPGTHGCIFLILQILVKKHRVSKILITYGKVFFINITKI
jgi:hypothetical protein